ncbi:MAG: M48 family metallopeptidase [Marmoricola sp.]
MRRTGRAVVAVALLLGVYFLAVAIVAALVWLAVAASRYGSNGALMTQVLCLAFVTTVGMLIALFKRADTRDPSSLGTELAPADHPRLWAEVTTLAKTVSTRPPDEIRLLPDVNAAVTEQSKAMGLVGGKRTMYLGAPLLLGLRRQQLRSILAHELGHYSGRHTALGGVTYRGREALGRIIHRFGPRSIIGRAFRAYAWLYYAVTFAMSRQQELEADDFSVQVAGRDTAVAALAELPVLDAAWDHYLEEFVGPVHAAGQRPSDFFDGFAHVLEAPKLQEALASFRTDFEEPSPGKYDTHPPLSLRIARIRAMTDDHAEADPTLAITLLDEPTDALLELQEWMYRESHLKAVPWSDLRQGHEPADVRARAEMLYRVAAEAEHRQIDLRTVVGSVRGRQLASWLRPHLEDPSADNITQAGRDLMQAAVDEALMSVSGARVALDWDSDPRLVATSGLTIDSRPVVELAMQSGAPAVLGEWLAEHGVSLDHVPEFPDVDPRLEMASQPPRVLEGLAPIAGHRKLFCLVLTHGVLLRKARPGDLFAWWTGGQTPGRHLLPRVMNRPGADLLAEEENIWLPWDRIVSVTVGRGRTRRPRITFTCLDGAVHRVRYRMQTRDSGETIAALKFFLEDRLALA